VEEEKGFAIWITGLPASGKSTITACLHQELLNHGFKVRILESDTWRKKLTLNPTYSDEERDNFYLSLAQIGISWVDQGYAVIFDATANRRKYRDAARAYIDKFMEVYVQCPLKTCIRRDPKGIYKAGKKGESHTVPGLQSSYEHPLEPEVVVQSDKTAPEVCCSKIMAKLSDLNWLSKRMALI
jgi:adenylylsulfate kinase